MIPGSCSPRLIFQLITRIVGPRAQESAAARNDPFSSCSITSHPDSQFQTNVASVSSKLPLYSLAAAAELADNVPGFGSLDENAISEYAQIIHARVAPTAPTQIGIQVRFKSANARSA